MFRLSFHNALYITSWRAHRRGELSDDQYQSILDAIKDDSNSPTADGCLCPQLELVSYNTGVDNGVIDATKQPLGTINWGGLLQFLTGLLPIILQIIAIFKPVVPPAPIPTPPAPAASLRGKN